MEKFFDIYKSELTKDTYTSDQVFNMDQSGVTVVYWPGKVISRREQIQIGIVTSGEKGQTATVICVVNADGFCQGSSHHAAVLPRTQENIVSGVISWLMPDTLIVWHSWHYWLCKVSL